jgi:magnesium-transporting ATPase (P-type)
VVATVCNAPAEDEVHTILTPSPWISNMNDFQVAYDDLACDLTLIATTGIEDPLRDGVREAVVKYHKLT